MKNWTAKRKAAFWVHTGFVAIPFTASTVASYLFWEQYLGSGVLAVAMILLVEVVALTGLVLYILRVPSPFQGFRHLLPFISIGPLLFELYKLISANTTSIGLTVTLMLVVAAVGVTITLLCFRTIEAQFVDPVQLAQEKQEEALAPLRYALEAYDKQRALMNAFAIKVVEENGVTLDPKQERKLIPSSEVLENTKPCPVCGEPLSHSEYMRAHRKNKNGEPIGCKHCIEVTA